MSLASWKLSECIQKNQIESLGQIYAIIYSFIMVNGSNQSMDGAPEAPTYLRFRGSKLWVPTL